MRKVPVFQRDYLIDLAARLRKPLKRRVSLRDSFLKKLRQEGTRIHYNGNGQLKRKRPLKKVSRAQRTKYRKYFAVQQDFLSRPENANCEICLRRREAGENIRLNASTEVHHKNGRGKRLCDESTFVASCRDCRLWPHEHPRQARELGLLV